MAELLVCLQLTVCHVVSLLENKRKNVPFPWDFEELCTYCSTKQQQEEGGLVCFLPPHSQSQVDHAIFSRGFLLCAFRGSVVNLTTEFHWQVVLKRWQETSQRFIWQIEFLWMDITLKTNKHFFLRLCYTSCSTSGFYNKLWSGLELQVQSYRQDI